MMVETQSIDARQFVNLLAVFYMHLLLYTFITIFKISSFPEPLFCTTISRCPVNFINLAAIIVAFWLSEYDSILRRDFRFHDKRGHPRRL